MKRSVQKWMAVILSCCICLSIWSAAALAAGTGEFDPVGNLLPNPGMEEGGQNQNEWTYDKNTFPLNLTTGDDGFAPHSGDSCMGYVLFEASAGDIVPIEITSFDPTQVGFWMDDVCLTLCEGTSLEGVWSEWDIEGEVIQEPEIAMQGEHCAYIAGGKSLNLRGPSLESGEYILTFSVRTLEEAAIPGVFRILSLASGEVYETEPFELANQWKSVTVRMQDPGEIAFSIESLDIPDVFIDNISLVRFDDFWPNPDPQPQELLTNRGFESGLSSWTHPGSFAAFTTTSQAHSGSQSVFMGYFTPEALNSYVSQNVTSGSGTYDLSAYIKTETNLTGTGAILSLEAKDANGSILASASSKAVSNSNGGWSLAAVSLNAPSGTKTVTVKIGGLYCTGGFFVDDVSLQYSS